MTADGTPARTDHPGPELTGTALIQQTFGPVIDPRRGRFGLRMSALKDKRKEYLTVKDLQKVLDSCKLHLNEVDEVWPKIYIGNV